MFIKDAEARKYLESQPEETQEAFWNLVNKQINDYEEYEKEDVEGWKIGHVKTTLAELEE